MVNAQEWLDKKYPKERKKWVKEIYLNEPNLGGELDLGDFTWKYGFKVYISPQVDETKLTFKNLPEGAEIIKLIEAQKYVDNRYPIRYLIKFTLLSIKWFRWERALDISHQNLEGHLDLSDFVNLKELNCSENKLTKLTLPTNPTNLEYLNLSYNNFPNQNLIDRFGSCLKCYQPKTSENWCHPCAEKEWKQDLKYLTGQELIEKFIEQQKERDGWNKLRWIPYDQFTDVEYLAEGGFSKIYKARWNNKNKNNKDIALKSLTNYQNITLEFLTEIANTRLADGDVGFVNRIVKCYGISQDPTTKNYVMVMEYMEDGNLRDYLRNKSKELSLRNKSKELKNIAWGLNSIHEQNLVHRDFHSGNILNTYSSAYISDLGLSRPVNHQKQDGQIFGVLPYVAPEVLQVQPYTKASDVYSFGIVAYELLANSYPYPEMNDTDLALKVCLGLRPNIDELLIPQELKDLINRCWDDDPLQRPSAEELRDIIIGWQVGIEREKNTPFYQQYQAIEKEYNIFSQNTPYQIHPTAITTSKMINTKQITQQLAENYQASKNLELDLNNFNLDELNLQEDPQEQSSLQVKIEINNYK